MVQRFEQLKPIGDVASMGTIAATVYDYLPEVTALLVFAWTIFRLANEVSIWRERRYIAAQRELKRRPRYEDHT